MTSSPDHTFPWARLMEIGMGVLGWSPNDFWGATLRDFSAALSGWQEAHGINQQHSESGAREYRRMRDMADSMPDVTSSIGRSNGR